MEMDTPRKLPRDKFSQLSQKLKDKKPLVRIKALEALVEVKHPNAFQEIVSALSDRNSTIRVTAAEGLGALKNKQGVAPLISKLTDRNYEVRMRASESLGILLAGRKSPPALIERLQDTDELVRIAAAESLRLIGDRKALPALWRAIHDRSPIVRSYVAAAIGRLGNKKDAARLEKELKHETSEVAKVGICEAIYLLGQREVLKDLLVLLQSTDYRVRCATANALYEIKADETDAKIILRALRKVLRNEPTIAAKSSIRSSLRCISQSHLPKSASAN